MKHDLKAIFDALLVGVVVLDDEGVIETANSEASRILGVSDQNLPGTLLAEHLGPDHPAIALIEQVRKHGRAAIYDEIEFPRRLEPPLPIDLSVCPVREGPAGASGRSMAITLLDRTASRSLHEEIRERERQESYGHIAAGIAHEVKNPLGGIRGAAELLGMAAVDARGRKTAQLIVDEVDRISNLVDELMVFARGDHLQLASVNIHQLLDSLLDLLELERGHEHVRVVRHFDPSLPELQADSARLQQVFLNLARNALQAMEGGGCLTLTTRMSLEHRIVGSDGRPQPTIEIGFHDTGPGIPREIQDRLATPFFTTRKKGTGLGLSMARHWARRHGGRLRIQSEAGEGTRVDVDLPLVPPSPEPDRSLHSIFSQPEKDNRDE